MAIYLYHSEKKTDWNRLLASREEDNLQRDYPQKITEAILSGGTGTLSEGANEIISYAPLFPANDLAGDVEPYSKIFRTRLRCGKRSGNSNYGTRPLVCIII